MPTTLRGRVRDLEMPAEGVVQARVQGPRLSSVELFVVDDAGCPPRLSGVEVGVTSGKST